MFRSRVSFGLSSKYSAVFFIPSVVFAAASSRPVIGLVNNPTPP